MTDQLFSNSWYRVEDIKPRLRSHIELHHHLYRGKDWYVLEDKSSGRFHRFSEEAYAIIGLMDGKRTVEAIWETACGRLGDDMPTQDEVITLLSQLHQVDALQTDIPPDITSLYLRHEKEKRNRFLAVIRSPMSIKIPLLDPDRFLDATLFLVRPLFSVAGFLLWFLIVAGALLLAGVNWEGLSSNVTDRVLSRENLILLWFIYPLVKIVHEMGHGYAVKRWGGEVHEIGVMFLVFIPIPYVEASSSAAFREKGKRMLVGGAGILVEVFLAALAMYIWAAVEPGIVRVTAYNVMIIAGISTVLFNGNPLLRFDAYYVLSDLLEIPNLGQRSNNYLGYLFKRYLFRMKEVTSPVTAAGEEGWLLSYAVASFIYRIFITVRIILFVAGKFFIIGVLLAIWAGVSFAIIPTGKFIQSLFTDNLMKRYFARIVTILSLAIALFSAFVIWVPVSSFTLAEGVVWVPQDAQVHTGADGFITEVITPSGTAVKEGDPLLRFESMDLETEVKVLEEKLREYKYRLRLSSTTDKTETQILREEIASIEAELDRARERRADLVVLSHGPGTFVFPANEADMRGKFMRNGAPVGYVVDFSNVIVRTIISQDDVDSIRHRTKAVKALLSESLDKPIKAFILREVPAATKELPSLALSLEGGGEIAVDPTSKSEVQAFQTHFHFDIDLPELTLKRVGERVYIRFEHDPEPLVYRWYRNIRRMLMRQFDV